MTITTQADRLAELPPIDEDDRQWLSYNPNTSDIVEWIQRYAIAALAKQQATSLGWPCEIETADFEANTITVKMLVNDYWVAAGKHVLIPLAVATQQKP